MQSLQLQSTHPHSFDAAWPRTGIFREGHHEPKWIGRELLLEFVTGISVFMCYNATVCAAVPSSTLRSTTYSQETL